MRRLTLVNESDVDTLVPQGGHGIQRTVEHLTVGHDCSDCSGANYLEDGHWQVRIHRLWDRGVDANAYLIFARLEDVVGTVEPLFRVLLEDVGHLGASAEDSSQALVPEDSLHDCEHLRSITVDVDRYW